MGAGSMILARGQRTKPTRTTSRDLVLVQHKFREENQEAGRKILRFCRGRTPQVGQVLCEPLFISVSSHYRSVAFWNDPKRRKAYETVKRGERTALSAGLIMHAGTFVDIEGARIKVIKSATLEELSLVPVGACRPAFCGLIDADGARSLEDDGDSLRILTDGSARR